MLTEDEARALLGRAAATIDVDESAPMTLTGLPEPPRRRWASVLVAAAAVVLLALGGGYVASRLTGGDPSPADTDPSVPVETVEAYDDDQVPPLIGYTREEAVALLEDRGLDVRVRTVARCDPATMVPATASDPAPLVFWTDPGQGATVARGDRVTVTLAASRMEGLYPGLHCGDVDQWRATWDLVRFARGLAGAPAFADEVTVAAGEDPGETLTADEAADPDRWTVCARGECHSALLAIAGMVTRSEQLDDEFLIRFPEVTDDPRGVGDECVTPDPHEKGLREHLPTYFWVTHPTGGGQLCVGAVVQIDWTEDFRIAGVRLRLPLDPAASAITPADDQRTAIAEAFVAWARGEGPPPAFADDVRYLVGGEPPFGAPTRVADPTDRGSWAACSGLPAGQCGLDPLYVLDHYQRDVVVTRARAGCHEVEGMPDHLAAGVETDLVSLSGPDPSPCRDDLGIHLWIDDAGAIYGLNLGTPGLMEDH